MKNLFLITFTLLLSMGSYAQTGELPVTSTSSVTGGFYFGIIPVNYRANESILINASYRNYNFTKDLGESNYGTGAYLGFYILYFDKVRFEVDAGFTSRLNEFRFGVGYEQAVGKAKITGKLSYVTGAGTTPLGKINNAYLIQIDDTYSIGDEISVRFSERMRGVEPALELAIPLGKRWSFNGVVGYKITKSGAKNLSFSIHTDYDEDDDPVYESEVISITSENIAVRFDDNIVDNQTSFMNYSGLHTRIGVTVKIFNNKKH